MNKLQKQKQAPETVSQRRDKYNRIKRLVNWVGGGLVALSALLTTDILKDHNLFLKLVVTGIVFSGVLAAHTRQLSDWGETQLRRELDNNSLLNTDAVPEQYQKYLSKILRCWKWALWCTAITGIIFMLGVWWAYLGGLWPVIADAFGDGPVKPMGGHLSMEWLIGFFKNWSPVFVIIATLVLAGFAFYQARAFRKSAKQKVFIDLVNILNKISVFSNNEDFLKRIPAKNKRLQIVVCFHNMLDGCYEVLLRENEYIWFRCRDPLKKILKCVNKRHRTHSIRLLRWYLLLRDYYIKVLRAEYYVIPYHRYDPHICKNTNICQIGKGLLSWDNDFKKNFDGFSEN